MFAVFNSKNTNLERLIIVQYMQKYK